MKGYTTGQFSRFIEVVEELRQNELDFPLRHAANSPVLVDLPETYLDLVRAGIIVYGLYPSDEVDHSRIDLRPAMNLKASVAHVKEVPAGFKVSYGCNYTTDRSTVIWGTPTAIPDCSPPKERPCSAAGERRWWAGSAWTS